jgi:Methyltransferase domain
MYRVARAGLARLTNVPPDRLDGYFAEIGPLHEQLVGSIARLPSSGAMMQAPLLYVLVRSGQPEAVVETGVSSGFSARLILEALARNGHGRLWSIGIPKVALGTMEAEVKARGEERPIGWLVPDPLRDRWELRVGPSETVLPTVFETEVPRAQIFIHDSLHSYERMREEYRLAWPHLVPGGWLLSHDIHNNRAWPEFLREHSLREDEELDHDLGVVRVPV